MNNYIKNNTNNINEISCRNLIGYGNNIPYASWPNKSKIAIQFVLNYEEGAEKNILYGDDSSETYLSDMINSGICTSRNMSIESIYEYGSRVGFWRVHNEFQKRNLPLTIFGVTMALLKNPEVTNAIKLSNYDIVSHGWRWIQYQNVDENTEKKHIKNAINEFVELFGKIPTGWYTGRNSINTRRLVVECGHFIYDSDYYGDELPFWTQVKCKDGSIKSHLIIPYSLECNDMRFVMPQGFSTSEHFYTYLRNTFDVLYKEGIYSPKMMSIGMHCRLIGRPGRFFAIQRFLDYIQKYDDAWICTRQQIADHWVKNHPPQ